jgi:Bardet-Biedl syndrome 9 protein
MSIFEIKEWWAQKVGDGEEFDTNSICVGNVDNSTPASNKIVVGSFEGFLRIYQPSKGEFKGRHLLLEKNLNDGILQVSIGKYGEHNEILLAVLHSKMLVIYAVESDKDRTQIATVYKHELSRNSFNFTQGCFGKSHHDMIWVQSVDGLLTIINRDSIDLEVTLPDFFLPGPLIYAKDSDSFIISNTNFEIECYRLPNLKIIVNSGKEKSMKPDWVWNIGEQAFHMNYHKNKNTKKHDIVVVGTQTLYILKEGDGKMRYHRRLDYPPSCIKTYHLNTSSEIYRDEKRNVAEVAAGTADSPWFTFLLGSFSNYILVYKDVQLVWTCKTSHPPIFTDIAKFGEQDGLIVHFADNGWLQVSFLGTEPPKLNYILPESKEMNYEEMDSEHQRLLARIMSHEQEEKTEPDFALSLGTQIFSVEEADEYIDDPNDIYAKGDKGKPIRMKVKLNISYEGSEVKNLMIHINLPRHLEADKTTFSYKMLNFGSRTPFTETFYVYPRNDFYPCEREIVISASYMSARSGGGNDLRTAVTKFSCPMALNCRVIIPSNLKDQWKVTLVTNKDAVQITSFFDDVIEALNAKSVWTTPNAISFMYHNNIIVSVLISKNAGKYRIQSSWFEALAYIVLELVDRLVMVYSNDVEIKLQDSIPLHELFTAIDDHFEIREKIGQSRKKLEDRSYQFRIVEKRLINRFKDKNPTPLNNLDFLLGQTYQEMMTLASEIEEYQSELEFAAHNLSCRVSIIQILLKHKFDLSDESYELLKHHLSTEVNDLDEWGWEEQTYAAMTSLLKSCLAKSSKEASVSNATIKKLTDTSKLKKHLTIVCDRLARGGVISI